MIMNNFLSNFCFNFERSDHIKIIIMKAMSKSELADKAGVSVQTLMNWCRPFRQELEAMGMLPNAKVLPPHIVKFLSEKFAIDV